MSVASYKKYTITYIVKPYNIILTAVSGPLICDGSIAMERFIADT